MIDQLQHLRERGLSYGQIQRLPEFSGIPRGTLSVICRKGLVPKRWRRRLGLCDEVVVVVVGEGEIPAGAQVLHASVCACGQAFIPNAPNRSKCFLCSPYRGKKK